ncbi:MAG TPA: alkaline phosphatase family protein [Candidatus Dormibacteraeota bacterium]|jgi:phospholipase C|nr:alkaline phosphatase family protein [Candidatus Dormibacteraeota bacterium]
MSLLTRRQVLAGAGAAVGLAAGGAGFDLVRAALRPTSYALPADPSKSGIEHVVVLMMENRSFDHFLGWMPGADGRQAGLTYYDKQGVAHHTHHLAPDYQGCANLDPDHSYDGGRVQFNHGANDGFLKSGNDDFALGYYTADDLPFLGGAAQAFTTFDRYFCSLLGPTYPNRLYQHSAQTDRTTNASTTSTMPTIWDRLAAAGLTGTYYFGDLPLTALYGTKYVSISKPVATFLADAAAGNLPSVSFVDPRFVDEGSGTSQDDHPHADIRAGETFMNLIYNAIVGSPNWSSTVFVINYDEWGGFYDHVPPPRTRDAAENADPAKDNGQRGFRVPSVLISPLARRGHVSHRVYDHTSILKMIEWRWDLQPLTVRDATANNIAEVLDFSAPPNLSAPTFTVPAAVSKPCQAAGTPISSGVDAGRVAAPDEEAEEWAALKAKALADGWRL